MEDKLDELFKSYDFGYDLDCISAENWIRKNGHFVRRVYLENLDKISLPIPADFYVYFDKTGTPNNVVVEMH